jgi:hypothetical protein
MSRPFLLVGLILIKTAVLFYMMGDFSEGTSASFFEISVLNPITEQPLI